MIVLGYIGDQKWCNVTKTYAFCLLRKFLLLIYRFSLQVLSGGKHFDSQIFASTIKFFCFADGNLAKKSFTRFIRKPRSMFFTFVKPSTLIRNARLTFSSLLQLLSEIKISFVPDSFYSGIEFCQRAQSSKP